MLGFNPDTLPDRTKMFLELKELSKVRTEAMMWTTDEEMINKLVRAKNYTERLAIIGNQRKPNRTTKWGEEVLPTFSMDTHKIDSEKFPRWVRRLDVSKEKYKSGHTDTTKFREEARLAAKAMESFKDTPKHGTALELLFIDMNHIIFKDLFNAEVSSDFDDYNRQVDALFFERPFATSEESSKFMFGLDFTTNGEIEGPVGVGAKVSKIIDFIKGSSHRPNYGVKKGDSFSVRFGKDSESETNVTAFNVPKLTAYIKSSVVEGIAKAYYELDHEKVERLLKNYREEILISLYQQSLLFARYSDYYQNVPMRNSYRNLAERLRKMITKNPDTDITKISAVSRLGEVLDNKRQDLRDLIKEGKR